jgi:hypothetical protein
MVHVGYEQPSLALTVLQPVAHYDVHAGEKEDAAVSAVLQANSFAALLPCGSRTVVR